MTHPLKHELGAVRRRLRLLIVLYALAWLVGGLVLAIAAVCLADYLIHFQDTGIRLMCTLLVLEVGLLGVTRFLWPALRAQYADLELALRIEQRFPALRERLASSLEFLGQPADAPGAGSAALRREVVARTTALAEPYDFREVIQPRPVWRAVAVSGAICAAGLAILVAAPAASSTALERLALPLGSTAWPKQNHLVFASPVKRVALGGHFEVELTDARGAPLPREVRIHYRYDDAADGAQERVELMKSGPGIMIASVDEVSRPFSYRAEGGDDDSMGWTRLEVIEPPGIEQLVLTLYYPAYTHWPSSTSEPHVRALAGTRVEISGKTTKPIRSATLKVESEPEVATLISDDGYGFHLPADSAGAFVMKKSGTYTIDLEDRDGFRGESPRYEMRVIEDHPPTLTLEEPSADGFISSRATVPVRATVKDDLAIRDAALHVVAAGAQGAKPTESVAVLYRADAPPPAPHGQAAEGESRVVQHRLDVGALKLAAGATLTLHLSASDFQPKTTHSGSRRLTILSPEELQDRLAERQSAILGEIGRVLKLEQQSRAQVSSLEIQLDQVGRLTKPDMDHLQQAELAQRQVSRGLGSQAGSLPGKIRDLLADLDNNKIDNADVKRRMQALLDEMGRLDQGALPVIAREMTAALKEFQAQLAEQAPSRQGAASPSGGRALAQAGQRQDEVVRSLEQMLAELSEWDNYRRFSREIGALRRQQDELARDTAALGNQTLTKEVADLDAQQVADLRKLAQRQAELTRHFEKVQQRMQDVGEQLRESDPLAADAVADAAEHARRQGLAGQMRQAGRNVEQNQLGQAGTRQQQALNDLDELLDVLANRRERELGRLVKKLAEAQEQLAKLAQQQQGLRKRMEAAAKIADEAQRRRELEKLSRDERELQAETERFARMLKRLQADQASVAASRGGAKMGQSGEQGQQGDGQGAAEQAQAAEKDLDEAQRQLAQQRRKAEADLAAEQRVRLADNLRGLKQQQETILGETRHYEQLRSQQKRLTRAQSTSVGDVARQQAMLHDQTRDIAKSLGEAVVFSLALSGAARDMQAAVRLLDERETGSATQQAQQHASNRLGQMLEALAERGGKPEPGGQKAGDGQGGAGQGGQPQRDGIPGMSELILLKLMQQEINTRTKAAEEARGRSKQPTPETEEDYRALGEEQGKLADLLLELAKPRQSQADADSLLPPDSLESGRETKEDAP